MKTKKNEPSYWDCAIVLLCLVVIVITTIVVSNTGTDRLPMAIVIQILAWRQTWRSTKHSFQQKDAAAMPNTGADAPATDDKRTL